MNPDEIMLLDWLNRSTGSSRLSNAMFNGIKSGSMNGKAWLEQIRQWSLECVEGATLALNAAERIYGKTLK